MYTLFWTILCHDIAQFHRTLRERIINAAIWISITATTASFILPAMGMPANYGNFILVSAAGSLLFFVGIHGINEWISDLNGNKSITYFLTLPIKQSLIFVRLALFSAYRSFIMASFVLPFGKLLLWNRLLLPEFSLEKYVLLLLVGSLFSGFFALFVASFMPNMSYIEHLWTRVVFPLWFLGGYQFGWYTLIKQLPVLAYIGLLNPMTYVMEGIRAAALGQEGSLNFWLCIGMLSLYVAIFAYLGVRRFKQRLDCID